MQTLLLLYRNTYKYKYKYTNTCAQIQCHWITQASWYYADIAAVYRQTQYQGTTICNRSYMTHCTWHMCHRQWAICVYATGWGGVYFNQVFNDSSNRWQCIHYLLTHVRNGSVTDTLGICLGYFWDIFGISHRCWVSVKRGFCVSRKWCQSRKALPEVSHQEEKKNRTMYHTSPVQCDLHKSYAVSHQCLVQWVREPSRSVESTLWTPFHDLDICWFYNCDAI